MKLLWQVACTCAADDIHKLINVLNAGNLLLFFGCKLVIFVLYEVYDV